MRAQLSIPSLSLSDTQLTHSHLIFLLAFLGSNDCREDGNCPPATEGLALCLQPKEQAMRSTAGRCTGCMRMQCNYRGGARPWPCHGTARKQAPVPVAVGDEPTPRPAYCHANNGPKRPVCRADRPMLTSSPQTCASIFYFTGSKKKRHPNTS